MMKHPVELAFVFRYQPALCLRRKSEELRDVGACEPSVQGAAIPSDDVEKDISLDELNLNATAAETKGYVEIE